MSSRIIELTEEQLNTAWENMREADNLAVHVERLEERLKLVSSLVELLAQAESFRIEKVRKK